MIIKLILSTIILIILIYLINNFSLIVFEDGSILINGCLPFIKWNGQIVQTICS